MREGQIEAAPDGHVRARLLSPEHQVTLAGLAETWSAHTISWRLRGYGRLVGDLSVLSRIRGAFGAALLAGASDAAINGRPCTFNPPSAFEALFRKQGRMTRGLDFPSPWVISIDAKKSDLAISLTLFGFAIDWAPAAAETMTRALRTLVEWPRTSPPLPSTPEVIECRATTIMGMEIAAGVTSLDIELLSPFVVTGADPRERPEGILTGLGTRLSGLARWHDLGLDQLIDWTEIKAAGRSLSYRFHDVSVAQWNRGSRRQGLTIPMSGLTGRIEIVGDLTSGVMTLLTLGSTCHMGADTVFGCGRYRIVDAIRTDGAPGRNAGLDTSAG